MYSHCENLHSLVKCANAEGVNPFKRYIPSQKSSKLTEIEMGCILENVKDHNKQIKNLNKVINQLTETIDSLKSKKILPSEACSVESSVSMEILEDGFSRDKRAELAVVNFHAVKQLEARNEEL